MKLTNNEKAIANEAFMMGRIYTTMGEKENPVDIHTKLMFRCLGVKKQLKREKKLVKQTGKKDGKEIRV